LYEGLECVIAPGRKREGRNKEFGVKTVRGVREGRERKKAIASGDHSGRSPSLSEKKREIFPIKAMFTLMKSGWTA